MNKLEALENIKRTWEDNELKLGDKITRISENYYSVGLDLSGTATYIKATPTEFDSLLALSGLDEEIIDKISEIDPPKTTWMMLANASDEEIDEALKALKDGKDTKSKEDKHFTISEYIYQKMLKVNGPTLEQRVSTLSGDDIKHASKKGEDYNVLNDWSIKFLKSLSAQKKRGKVFTDKQIKQLIKALDGLSESGAIKRNSIDGDQEICDRILDALGK